MLPSSQQEENAALQHTHKMGVKRALMSLWLCPTLQGHQRASERSPQSVTWHSGQAHPTPESVCHLLPRANHPSSPPRTSACLSTPNPDCRDELDKDQLPPDWAAPGLLPPAKKTASFYKGASPVFIIPREVSRMVTLSQRSANGAVFWMAPFFTFIWTKSLYIHQPPTNTTRMKFSHQGKGGALH